MKNIRIADVALFLTAAQMKNLGKAAAFHHLSQSGASAAIKRVEEALNISLCLHEKRQFRLTREGQILIPRLENWLRDLQEILVPEESLPIRLITTHAIAKVTIPAILSIESIDFKQQRPDKAYASILKGEADIAIVLDNSPWKGVITAEIGSGYFQLFSRHPDRKVSPVLLPEDQMEVLALKQKWEQIYGTELPVKATIPSWSLIASICQETDQIGFLPDFLGKKYDLFPVRWQPDPSPYRMLAIYRNPGIFLEKRIERLLNSLTPVLN